MAGRLLLLNENSTLICGLTEAVTATNVLANQDIPSGTLLDEQLVPSWKKQIKNCIPQLELWMKKYSHHWTVVEEEKTKHDGTPNVNAIKRSTKTTMDQMTETCDPDKV